VKLTKVIVIVVYHNKVKLIITIVIIVYNKLVVKTVIVA